MAINLISGEKKALLRFLFLYLGSSFILILIIAFFYYENEKKLYADLIKSNMNYEVSLLSSKIIYAHMTNNDFDPSILLANKKYKMALYNVNKEKILGNLVHKIDFDLSFRKHGNNYVLTDDSALGHLGVYYITLEEHSYTNKVEHLQIEIFIFFSSIYFFVTLLAFYLAKLFIAPIKEERIKLNNFIKDSTHELNTPLTAILMSIQNDNLSTKQIQRIRISAKRISDIYKDLRYLFLENNKEKKDSIDLDLSLLIKEQVESLSPQIKQKKINIILDLQSTLYKIKQEDFERLFLNLLNNAIKYNKIDGKISIFLKNNTLSIEDSGIGINKDKIKDIFKRYYRATSEQGGFGIGLSIVERICEEYNINIQVKSEEKIGTTFTLKL